MREVCELTTDQEIGTQNNLKEEYSPQSSLFTLRYIIDTVQPWTPHIAHMGVLDK